MNSYNSQVISFQDNSHSWIFFESTQVLFLDKLPIFESWSNDLDDTSLIKRHATAMAGHLTLDGFILHKVHLHDGCSVESGLEHATFRIQSRGYDKVIAAQYSVVSIIS
ncbi:hypothetical protein AVEN_145222-1 [Araneus ventricosus]|uniref:Uncharacterized protein n=1 Tax=Araneus ventricosus TaxID=182803 RepID=A0A4Y2L5Z0_ARAVE|nr:hypothetical protein AVEN_145222-1 [Araneus ventricosus]